MNNKKGIVWLSPASIISGIVLLLVCFAVVTNVYPTLTTYGQGLNATGIPLVGVAFGTAGFGWIIIGAAILLAVVAFVGVKIGKK